MKQVVKEGEFKPFTPMDLAHVLVGIVNSFVFEWIIGPQSYPLVPKGDAVLGIFLNGVQRMERRR